MTRPRLPPYVTRDFGHDKVERFYFRRPGKPKVRIHGVPWTPSFMAAYDAAQGGTVVKQGIAPQKSGTFSWLCEQYFTSGEFRELDELLTKPRRRNTLLKICREPIAPGSSVQFGNVMLSNWNKKAVRALRDRVADKPGAASDWLKSLRAVFKYGVDADHCDSNPTRDVAFLRSNNVEGHHPWTIEEVEQFENVHAVGSEERLAMGLLLYVAQRLSDVIRLGPSHIKMRPTVIDGKTVDRPWLVFTQRKGRKRKPIHMEIPVRPELQELLDATPIGTETFLVGERTNEPHSERGFSDFFAKACVAAGVPGRSHGLRKAAASRLAELGASEKEIMAITGHTTSQEIKRYTESASKRILAEAATAKTQKKGKA